jgi:hypothetical protein
MPGKRRMSLRTGVCCMTLMAGGKKLPVFYFVCVLCVREGEVGVRNESWWCVYVDFIADEARTRGG